MPRSFRSFAVIPAAGRSERMGRAKLLLPWGDGTVAGAVTAAWRAGGVSHLVAVVHPDDQRLAEVFRSGGAEVVVAQTPPPDMKASVLLALEHLARHHSPDEGDAWLLAPADVPGLSPRAIAGLLAEHDPSRPEILVPAADGRRGHPVLIPWPLAARVHALAATQGVRTLLDRHPPREIPLPAADALPPDIDTLEDYQRIKRDRSSS